MRVKIGTPGAEPCRCIECGKTIYVKKNDDGKYWTPEPRDNWMTCLECIDDKKTKYPL